MTSQLFSPLTLRNLTFPNRIMVSPMGQCSADKGCATDWHIMHLGSLSVSGAGAVVVEATAVNPNGRNTSLDLGLWNDQQADALARVIQFCRQHSVAKFGLQLWHVGRKGSVLPAWERHRPISQEEGGWEVFGASDIAYPGRNEKVSMLSKEGIRKTVDDFVAAARRADQIGLDFLEVHGAHGYLLHNFLSPLTNNRDDEYGGSLQNRMRFPLEVFDAVRSVWPEEKPMGMRLSATDWYEGGWSVEDSVALSKELKSRGCDYITASSGGSVREQQIEIKPNYQVPFAEIIRREVGIPTIAVGLITEPKQAEDILQNDQADMVALARGMIYNPRWPWHAAMELGEEPTFPVQYERAHPTMRRHDFLKSRREV
ncbi:NADH:flavin oxidoreductase/NADH oxidase [Roseovarius pacificus]|uniref:NADH:flavin oxidoreductase/NADH oxidase n=1 Tax=Roseovarius pacificus TaxID=337701 RepID=UPI002A18ABBC|nr:NADH:flavin oxidoreductase/NADH oxidase [Roseovarius pacificus]